MIATVLVSMVIGTVFQFIYFYAMGVDPSTLFYIEGNKNHLKVALFVTQLSTFLIPALVFARIAFKERLWSFFGLNNPLQFSWLMLAVTMLFFLLPLIQFTYEINQSIPLPEWMLQMEEDATNTLETIIRMDDAWDLIINLLLIAILPALGEEFLFRGVIQQLSVRIFNHRIAAVWFTAFIFSAIHFQFEGFIPRFILGLYLGYLFYWTNNLWVPIIAHFFNNGIMVLLSYFNPEMINDIDETPVPDLPWYGIIVSCICIIPLIIYFRNIYRLPSSPDKQEL
jgi:membrane protease YdiL (CAAX protease family)